MWSVLKSAHQFSSFPLVKGISQWMLWVLCYIICSIMLFWVLCKPLICTDWKDLIHSKALYADCLTLKLFFFLAGITTQVLYSHLVILVVCFSSQAHSFMAVCALWSAINILLDEHLHWIIVSKATTAIFYVDDTFIGDHTVYFISSLCFLFPKV